MHPRVKACSLVSGSSGNSIYIATDSTAVLVDAGSSCKRLENNMAKQDIDPNTIDAILITHEHSDHIGAVSVLARRYDIPVYSTESTLKATHAKIRYADKLSYRPVATEENFKIKDFSCKAIRVSHDAIEPVCYRIDTGKAIVAVITDIGMWTNHLSRALAGCDLVFLEANYDEHMLWTGKYSWPLKKRIDSNHGHLSNAQSAEAAKGLIESGTSRLVLIHLSKNNNRPDLVYNYFDKYLEYAGIQNGSDYSMITANRYEPSLWQYL